MARKMLVISGLDVWSMGTGKGAQSLYQTLVGYAEAGWQVHFLTGNKKHNSDEKIHHGVNIIRFDLPWLKKLYSWRIISHVAKCIWWLLFLLLVLYYGTRLARRHKIDLFYGYDTLGVPGAYLLSRFFKKPVISRFQGTTIGYFRSQSYWKLKYWDQILALKIPSDLLIMTNDGQEEDQLLEELGVDMSRVRFWMNGIRKDFTLPPGFNSVEFKKVLGLEPENKIILTVSRLHKWKRIDRVITAMPVIISSEPEARLVIVGEGEEYPGLLAQAERLNVAGHIIFAGSVVNDEIPKYLAMADVFVSCNDSANIGNPLLEAMVTARCIVTLNNGSTGQLVRNGETGVLIDMENIDSMGSVIASLLGNPEKRLMLGKNAADYAARNFWTWPDRHAAERSEVINLLRRRLAEQRKPLVFMMSSVHNWDDPRIFHKEALTLSSMYRVELHAVAPFPFREVNGVKVYGLRHYSRRIFRILNWARLLWRTLWARAAFIHFHDPELIPLGLFLRLIKRKTRIIYDIHEHNDATIIAREWIPRLLRRPVAWLVNKVELFSAGIFNGIIVVDSEMERKFSNAPVLEVIRNFPMASFGQKQLEERQQELAEGKTNHVFFIEGAVLVESAEPPEIKKDPVIIYLGVMGKDRGLETILDAMPLVRAKVPGAVCLLVGRVSLSGLSSKYHSLLDDYLNQGIIAITGQVEYESVMNYLVQSCAGWIPFPPIAKHRWGIGTKLIEYMALSLPVVASDYGEGGEVVRRENCGILVNPENPAAHADALALLLTRRDLAAELGRNGREAFLQRYCWEAQGERLLDFYNRVMTRKPPMSMIMEIKEDLAVAMAPVRDRGIWVKIFRFLQKPGIWAVLGYRVGRRLYRWRCLPARLLLGLYKIMILVPLKLLTCIELYPETKIGSGFYIEHYGNIFIAPTAVIGRNFTIFQGVTVGADLGGSKAGVIGDNVIICAGAKVIGDIVVGNNVVIGANTVVTADVEDNVVVGGVPARVIRRNH